MAGTGSYGAWGTPDTDSVTLGGFGFTGEQVDPESGFVYLRNRSYDPATSRFLTPDPLGFAGSGVNLYAYVGNNPVTGIDPNGLAGDIGGWFGIGPGSGGPGSGAAGFESEVNKEILERALRQAGDSSATQSTAIEHALDPSVKEGVVCGAALFIVERHLNGYAQAYGDETLSPEIKAELDRIVAAQASGETISGADWEFYRHELFEALIFEEFKLGYTDEAQYRWAHNAALERFGVTERQLFADEVIKEHAVWFPIDWSKER